VEVWNNRANYFISPDETPAHASEYADAFAHRCGIHSVFYRGIRVHDAKLAPRWNGRQNPSGRSGEVIAEAEWEALAA